MKWREEAAEDSFSKRRNKHGAKREKEWLTVEADEDGVSLQLCDVDHAGLWRVCQEKGEDGELISASLQQLHRTKEAASAFKPASVNQEEVVLGFTVPKRTTWLSSVPLLTATQIRGYMCSGTTNISKTSNGHGNGKSMFYRREGEKVGGWVLVCLQRPHLQLTGHIFN